MIRLFDTATRQVKELDLREPGRVSMYVCGPTVYDAPHIGHGRFVLVFDVLRRFLEWTGLEVRYVSNITDVDDKIIARASRENSSEEDVARKWEKVWYDAIDGLGVKRPDADPHATAYIDQMVDLTTDLIEKGMAYVTSDGVYLEVGKVEGYGLLAGQSLESLQAGARVEVVEEKKSAADFALWKGAKEGEPAWPSPWGAGRPGWHTECVVMSLDLLGEGFDIHGGGQDLAFPHHENERAQAVAAGREFARHWVHNGFVEVAGEKMSKSLGNFTSLTDLLDRTDPRAYRLLVLQSHYRAPVEVTEATADQASRSLQRLDEFARRTADLLEQPPAVSDLESFRAAMEDDMDTPRVLAQIFELVRKGNSELAAGEFIAAAEIAATVREITRAVGLEAVSSATTVDDGTAALVRERDVARANKDFARSDAIRDQLVAAGWVVEDTSTGTKVRRS